MATKVLCYAVLLSGISRKGYINLGYINIKTFRLGKRMDLETGGSFRQYLHTNRRQLLIMIEEDHFRMKKREKKERFKNKALFLLKVHID